MYRTGVGSRPPIKTQGASTDFTTATRVQPIFSPYPPGVSALGIPTASILHHDVSSVWQWHTKGLSCEARGGPTEDETPTMDAKPAPHG